MSDPSRLVFNTGSSGDGTMGNQSVVVSSSAFDRSSKNDSQELKSSLPSTDQQTISHDSRFEELKVPSLSRPIAGLAKSERVLFYSWDAPNLICEINRYWNIEIISERHFAP